MRFLNILALGCLCYALPSVAYDFKACEQKAALSMERVGKTYGVAIAKRSSTTSVLFVYAPKQKPIGYKILKHDPFVGMYLLESKQRLEPVEIKVIPKEILEDEIASIHPNASVSGKIATRMQSPVDFATLNIPTFENSLISRICDHSYGIGIGGNAFIEKTYLERFINGDVYYGDIGVRAVETRGGVEVDVVDPFFPGNPFRYQDIIISIDGEQIPNLASFRRIVFDLQKGRVVSVQIERKGVVKEVQVAVDGLRGGMLLPEDFFSRVHFDIDEEFVITRVGREAKDGFENLRVGDKVLRINQEEVPKGKQEIIRLLGKYPDQEQLWLISRNDFQFFLQVNRKKAAQTSITQGLLSEENRFSF